MRYSAVIFVALVASSYGSNINYNRFLREESPSEPCMIEDLNVACHDDSVNYDELVGECSGKSGISAARCYMDYLCENSEQETVDSHKACIDSECPLAKHINTEDCSKVNGSPAAGGNEDTAQENEDTSDTAQSGGDAAEAPEDEDTPSTAQTGGDITEAPERQEKPNVACTIEDLNFACHDETVDHDSLEQECSGATGIPAARCYMDYLCENEEQEKVERHKDCIDSQCPLARHISVEDCSKVDGGTGATSDSGVHISSSSAQSGADDETDAPDSGVHISSSSAHGGADDATDAPSRQENPSDACTIEDLNVACHDDSVDHDTLEAECHGRTSILAARCYMDYLCENHDQETVDNHKQCIDNECPLAKHIGTEDCSLIEGGTGATTDTRDNDTGDMTELFEEKAEVTKPPAGASKGKSGIGGGGIFGILVLVAVVLVAGYFVKQKFFGSGYEVESVNFSPQSNRVLT